MAEILTLKTFRLTEPGPMVEMSPIRRDVLEEDVKRSYGTIQKLRAGGWIR